YGATLRQVDAAAVEKMPGVITVVRDGKRLAVIAAGEYQAVAAMRALAAAAQWDEQPALPDPATLFEKFAELPAQTVPVHDAAAEMPAGAQIVEANYRRAYQMHAAIGPSCAV